MIAAPKQPLHVRLCSGKLFSPNKEFASRRTGVRCSQPFQAIEWHAGHPNQKNRCNTITSRHLFNKTEAAGSDKLKSRAEIALDLAERQASTSAVGASAGAATERRGYSAENRFHC